MLLSRASVAAAPSRRRDAAAVVAPPPPLTSTSRIASTGSLSASARRQVKQRMARASSSARAGARSRGALVVEANELNKWCVPGRVAVVWKGRVSSEGGERMLMRMMITLWRFFFPLARSLFEMPSCSPFLLLTCCSSPSTLPPHTLLLNLQGQPRRLGRYRRRERGRLLVRPVSFFFSFSTSKFFLSTSSRAHAMLWGKGLLVESPLRVLFSRQTFSGR